jgi:hypothetical protein
MSFIKAYYIVLLSSMFLLSCDNEIKVDKAYQVKVLEIANKWQKYEPLKSITINKEIKSFSVNELAFIVTWDEQLAMNKDKGDFDKGIKRLDIYKNGEKIQTLESIIDEDRTSQIILNIFDYNFDGELDFTLPLGYCGKSCYYKYYIFNPTQKKFEHIDTLDYKRIQEVNTKEKLIKTVMEGTCCEGDYYIYKIDGYRINEKEKVHIK